MGHGFLSNLGRAALGVATGGLSEAARAVDLTGSRARSQARGDLQQGINEATGYVQGGYPTAQQQVRDAGTAATDAMTNGYANARGDALNNYDTGTAQIKGGFQSAKNAANAGYGQARSDAQAGYGQARSDAKAGYNAAQGRYETPEIVASRQQLYNRVLGKGGYTADQLNTMKGNTRDEYGTALREGVRNTNQYFGDSGGSGMAGENFGRLAASLGTARANATRDIDVNNANLVRQEQTGAMQSLANEAGARAGIDTHEGDILAGIGQNEGNTLAGISQNQGNTLANLNAQQGTALGNLSADEAKLLSGMDAQSAQALAQIKSQTGLNLASLTTEEAQMLAQIAAGGGAQMAATRNTAGLMPLVGAFVQGAGQGIGRGVMGGA